MGLNIFVLLRKLKDNTNLKRLDVREIEECVVVGETDRLDCICIPSFLFFRFSDSGLLLCELRGPMSPRKGVISTSMKKVKFRLLLNRLNLEP